MKKEFRSFLISVFLGGSIFCAISCSHSAKKVDYTGHGPSSVDPKIVGDYAPPALNPAISRKIQNYLDIRAPGLGLLSADKKQMFFGWSVTGTAQVWKLNKPKDFPVQMTGGEDSTHIVGTTPDGKWILIQRDHNGEEYPGLYLQSTEGGSLVLIQHKLKVQTEAMFVSDDSKYVYYRANDRTPESYSLYRYNILDQKSELIFDQSGDWSIIDYKSDAGGGLTLLLNKQLTNTAAEIYEYHEKSKVLQPILGQNEKEEYAVMFGTQAGEFIVLTPKFSEFRRLYKYRDAKWKLISPKELNWDVTNFVIDHPRTKIVYTTNENGYTKAAAVDAKKLSNIQLPDFKNADHVFMGSFTRDGRTIMFGVETAKAPRTSYSYEFSSKKLTQWVVPSSPEINTKQFAVSKLEYYTAKDGTKIPMFVRRPESCEAKDLKQPCAVIVHFHGGPEGQSLPGFSSFAQIFVDEGFIFVEPNVRGSDGYGKKWFHSDDQAKRLDVISDIQDASIFIKKNWAIKGVAPKVGVMGWSYGGYSALYAMTKYAGAYDAGVAIVGMSNLVTFLNNTAPYRRALRTPEYGDPEKDKDALLKLSPITYVDQVKNPLLIMQGANDPRVPVGEALQMYEAMSKKSLPSKLIVFPDEGHGSIKRSNRVLELGHTLQFFDSYLLSI